MVKCLSVPERAVCAPRQGRAICLSDAIERPVGMLLSELLSDAGITPQSLSGDAELTALTDDSRQVGKGACFVAIRGAVADGHRFIASAAEAGATAVICEDAAQVPAGIPHAVVADTREAIGPLAQAIHGHPGRALSVVGVTGTNGKTTVTWLLRRILESAGFRPGLLGTICYEAGARHEPATTTTPDPIHLAAMMAETVAAGGTHMVMEVSSHALDQHRVAGVDFDVVVLTNITGDHLDYHGTPEAYVAAKRRLFESLRADAVAVINRDDPAGDLFEQASQAPVTWYGLSSAAEVWARIDRVDIGGTEFLLTAGERQMAMTTPLIGRHNVYNCVAAAAVADALGVDLQTVADALAKTDCIPGRLQRVASEEPFSVFVDYAHTDDALSNVLGALRPITAGRLILVFGCGGDRDRTKRPRMARVAQDFADQLVITSDNPRTEDPPSIINEILTGLDNSHRRGATVLVDRRSAIAEAIGQAQAGDVVLIAGKGHETYQVIGDRRIDFNDAAVASEILANGSGQR
ncbi:MAG TPA: UDP-N-acetylmuramoyl-L-alanyl-D-glutamate--2,6-diaminopimelate ligase [Phycisphaerae bacterium]|nr:UDP-N-acetylmuramoyl-L-alanyl-D-glutamate--2,6-diaminopimelate ligase [Phycisphaerae bacterium]HDZ43816.1 UDP-N-acetylmuramoyl-L-alanyl-D-glutamate--2,6-diaminopimelate ligase [Phycisphaerae bacterium]